MAHLWLIYLLKIVIFHSYVSLPEGKPSIFVKIPDFHLAWGRVAPPLPESFAPERFRGCPSRCWAHGKCPLLGWPHEIMNRESDGNLINGDCFPHFFHMIKTYQNLSSACQ